MKLSPERLAGLARTLVETLTASGLIEPVSERRALTAGLERVITAEMTVEDRIKQVFGIKVRLENSEDKLRAGMSADVFFPDVGK